jgi:hypothetical protein
LSLHANCTLASSAAAAVARLSRCCCCCCCCCIPATIQPDAVGVDQAKQEACMGCSACTHETHASIYQTFKNLIYETIYHSIESSSVNFVFCQHHLRQMPLVFCPCHHRALDQIRRRRHHQRLLLQQQQHPQQRARLAKRHRHRRHRHSVSFRTASCSQPDSSQTFREGKAEQQQEIRVSV